MTPCSMNHDPTRTARLLLRALLLLLVLAPLSSTLAQGRRGGTPSQEEIRDTVSSSLNPDMFKTRYGNVSAAPEAWSKLPVPEGDLYQWDPESTYIQAVPFFKDISDDFEEPADILGARVLVMLGDFVTTDHISPAAAIP